MWAVAALTDPFPLHSTPARPGIFAGCPLHVCLAVRRCVSYNWDVAVGETLTMQFEIDPIRGTCNVSLTVDLDAADTQCVVAVA